MIVDEPEYQEREARQLLLILSGARGKEQAANRKLSRLKEKLALAVAEIEEMEQTKMTGWYALLSKRGDRWVCIGCVNPDETDEIPESELIIPIPEPASVPEFSGF